MDRLLVREGGRDIALHPRRPALPNIDISDAEYFDSAEALDSGKHRPGVEFADPAPAKRCSIPMKPPSTDERPRSRPSPVMLNVLTALIGIVTLCAGIGWLVYTWIVDMEVPYFAIPLVICVPVIAAAAFRNFWD
jgi:hypothetical protein